MSGKQAKRRRREAKPELVLPQRLQQARTDALHPSGEAAGRINAYVCHNLHAIVTENHDAGVTPMFTTCPLCSTAMASRMYQVAEDLEPTHQWYRAKEEDLLALEFRAVAKGASDGIRAAIRQHARNGGLFLRAIGARELVLVVGQVQEIKHAEVEKDDEGKAEAGGRGGDAGSADGSADAERGEAAVLRVLARPSVSDAEGGGREGA
jgi:hypothetical protein